MEKTNTSSLWKWFLTHEKEIIDCIENNSPAQHISDKLDDLVLSLGMFTWQIGEGKNKPWFFTISPNGDKDLLNLSKKIIRKAPLLSNWEFNYCHPAKKWNRKFNIFDESMNNLLIDGSGWHYIILVYDDNEVDLLLEANNIGYLDENTKIIAANTFVTNEIGEEQKINRIKSIKLFSQLEECYFENKLSVKHLKEHFNNLTN